MKIRTLLILSITVFTATYSAMADTFRCPTGDIASTGDKIGEVAIKCGTPTYKTRRTIESGSFRGFTTVEIEEWTYNMGSHDFVYTLTFRNGVLSSVASGDYGK